MLGTWLNYVFFKISTCKKSSADDSRFDFRGDASLKLAGSQFRQIVDKKLDRFTTDSMFLVLSNTFYTFVRITN